MTHRSGTLPRTLTRALIVGAFAATLGGVAPAFADEPTGGEAIPPVSAFDFVVVLLLIPLGLGLVISLLAALPSLIKGDSYAPGQPWVGEGEWFGGPRKAVDPAEEAQAQESAGDRGGAGAEF